MLLLWDSLFFFQAEDGIRDLVRSRGLGDVYKRQFLHDPEDLRGVLRVDPRLLGELFDREIGRPRPVLSLIHI